MIRSARQDSLVREKPSETAAAVAALHAGEEFAILDITAGWAWGYRRADHHVGYVPAAMLDFD